MVDGVRTTHDLKIGDHHFLVRPSTYRKRPAPQFGPRFTTGDPDYNNLSAWQHWVQKCWVGGLGADEWQDDAMYDEAVGVDSSNHEVLLLSRDMGPNSDRVIKNWHMGGEFAARKFFVWKNALYVLAFFANSAKLWRYGAGGNDWTLVKTFTERVRSFAEFRTFMYFGDQGTQLTKMTGTPAAETFTTFAKPSGEGDVPYAMAVYKDHMYVGFGQQIWRMNLDGVWDGSTAFYTDHGINYLTQMEVHLGFLYMASQNGHILRTDGNNTFDMWHMEQGVGVGSIRSFDGRLFLACQDMVEGQNSDPWEGGLTAEAVLYQFSGAAVTELKRWGRVGRYLAMGNMRVLGGRLVFGATDLLGAEGGGFGIAMYDPREDAYHLLTCNRDDVTYVEGINNQNWVVDDVIFFSGSVWASVRGHGIYRTALTYRDTTRFLATYETFSSGGVPASKNGGWLTSSDFDAGTPGLLKVWNAVTVEVDLPTASQHIFLEYSIDGGQTWSSGGSLTGDGVTTRYDHEFILGTGLAPVRAGRFKWRLTLHSDTSSGTPAVRGVIVRYLPIPEPNWMWDMTLVLSEEQELLDKSIQSPDNGVKLAALRAAFRQQDLVSFTDVGEDVYASCLVYNMEELVPHLGPGSEGALEREIRLTLLEMVEVYE